MAYRIMLKRGKPGKKYDGSIKMPLQTGRQRESEINKKFLAYRAHLIDWKSVGLRPLEADAFLTRAEC